MDLVSRRAIKPSLWERIEPELIDAWLYFVTFHKALYGRDLQGNGWEFAPASGIDGRLPNIMAAGRI